MSFVTSAIVVLIHLTDLKMDIGKDYIGVSVVYFCYDGAGRFLMAKRSDNARDEQGKWDIGGGKIEPHDTVIDSLQREVSEEYCADILDYQFLGYRDAHRTLPDGTPTHWIALDFAVKVDPDTVAIGEPHKLTDLQWFTRSTKPRDADMHSQLPLFFTQYNQDLARYAA